MPGRAGGSVHRLGQPGRVWRVVTYRLRQWVRRWILAGGLRRVVASAVPCLPAVLGFWAISGSLLYGVCGAAALVIGLVAVASASWARQRGGLTTEQRRAAASAIWLGTSTDDPSVAAAILKRLDRLERSRGRLTNSAPLGAVVTAYWAWLSYRNFQHHHDPAGVAGLLLTTAGIVQLATLPVRRRADVEQEVLARRAAQAVLAHHG